MILIKKYKQCTNDCSKISGYQYEFRNICYNQCPSDESYPSQNKQYFCEVKCDKQNPFEIIEEQTCTNFCGINDMVNNICISKYEDEETIINLILNNIHKDIITTHFDKSVLYNNNNIVIKELDTTFTITTNGIQKASGNSQIINLGECEDILKNYYNLENTNNLIILIINVNKNIEYDKTVYEVYADLNGNNLLTKLDLNICNNILMNNEISKCSNFSIESLLKDLCISCIDNYYPINNNPLNQNSFIKRYQLPQGYYLDNNEKYYEKCYLSCDSCELKGNYTNHNCILCAHGYIYELNIFPYKNCYKNCTYYTYYDLENNTNYCTPDLSCPKKYDKLIPYKHQCVKDCSKDSFYKYEFRHTCFEQCPNNISTKSEEKDFYCLARCPKDFPFEIIETQFCTNNCSISERQKELCKINYESNNEEDKEAQEKAIDNVKEELTKDFDTTNIDKGESIVIKQKDSTITISTTDNQKSDKYLNISTIDLGECEDKIKEEYNIPKNKSLYILKIDVNQKGLKIPKIEYEVYYPLFGESLIKLNMTVCKDSRIDLSIPVEITEDIDKVNSSSSYYNDICYTYTSEDGTDISLSDRKKNFVDNNLSVCEEDCDFNEYNMGKAVCSCKVKTNSTTKIGDIVIDKEKLYKNFINFKNIANINVLKCYKLIFKIEAYKSNYANIVLIVIILLFIITFIIFCVKDYPGLINILNMIEFFKLNENLVKKFKERQKREENKNIQKKKLIKEDSNTITSNIIPESKKHDKTKFKRPSFFQFFDRFKTTKNNIKKNSNPIKKSKTKILKSKNIKNSSNIKTKDLINRLQANKRKNDYTKNGLIEEIKEIDEKEYYDMFLKISKYCPTELNNISYKKALKVDKRSYIQYYISLIFTKHLLFFSFIPVFDYNIRILKIFLFFINFTVNFAINALFFNDETMHKIYSDKGSFDFIYNIPQIIYSALLAGFINALIQSNALTDSLLIQLRNTTNKKNIKNRKIEIIKMLKIKFFLFFSICLIVLGFFWYYLACFCAVYKNTQLHLIKDTIISFATSMISPFFINLFPGIFRIIALNDKKMKKEYMFKFSKVLQIF